MRIGVNLLPFRQHLAGAGRYAKNVLENLAEIVGQNIYYLFMTEQGQAHFQIPRDSFIHILCPFSPRGQLIRILWEQLVLPWQLLYYRIDLLFTPSVAIPAWVPCTTVTTIHDMIPFHREITKYPKIRAAYIRRMTSRAARRSDIVLTVSENSKREIAQLCRIPEEKILVAPNGVDARYRPIDAQGPMARCRARYGLPARFILFVGTLEPGKNLLGLIEAFRRLKSQGHIPHKLVIVGPHGWGTKPSFEAASEPDLRDEIRITGYIPEEDLPLVYNAADLFVFPSHYEGFGLPALEAMACGIPVIASNVSALPEVIGDAGLLIDPHDVDGLASAMERVLTDQGLRGEMIRKGLERARGFSWRRTAEMIIKTFATQEMRFEQST